MFYRIFDGADYTSASASTVDCRMGGSPFGLTCLYANPYQSVPPKASRGPWTSSVGVFDLALTSDQCDSIAERASQSAVAQSPDRACSLL